MSLLVIENLDKLDEAALSYTNPYALKVEVYPGDEDYNKGYYASEDVKVILKLTSFSRGVRHLNSDKLRDTFIYNVAWGEDPSYPDKVDTFFQGSKVFTGHLIFAGDIPEKIKVKATTQYEGSSITELK